MVESAMKRFRTVELPPPFEGTGKAVLDHLLRDARARDYLQSQLHKAFHTSMDLAGSDLVELVFLNDRKIFLNAVARLESLPFRAVEAVKLIYRKVTLHHKECFENVGKIRDDGRVELTLSYEDDACMDEWDFAYTSRLEDEIHEQCLPVFEDNEDVSDYTQPDTVLHDAYVYHSMGNEDTILEQYREDLQSFYEETTDKTPALPGWLTVEPVDHARVWVRKPRVRIVIVPP